MTSSDAFYMVGRMSVLIVSQEAWISANIQPYWYNVEYFLLFFVVGKNDFQCN